MFLPEDLLERPGEASSPVGAGHLALEAGRVLGLVGAPGFGLTRVGLALLASSRGGTVAVVDVRGWFCPSAAWEVGVPPERLVVVRCPDRTAWPRVVAALLEGLPATYAEVPAGVKDGDLRRLGALARARRSALVLRPLRGDLPPGLLHLRLRAGEVHWEGTEQGHGRLIRRSMVLQASGKGVGGIDRTWEVEDDGTDAVRVLPGLAPASARRAVG